MALSRRSFFGLLAGAAAAPIAAKLPAPARTAVLRYDVPAGEVYGVGPAMTAMDVMRRHNEAIREFLERTKDIDIIDCIDWNEVHKQLGAYGIACVREEEVCL